MHPDVNSQFALSGADAFDAWWQLPGEWVEAPNIRRGGESGVKRIIGPNGQLLYRKQQIGHIYRSLRHPFGHPTAMRERNALLACAALKVNVPTLVYAECRKVAGEWQALLITEALDGYSSLEKCYSRGTEQTWGELLHQQVLHEVGVCLARFNRGRWQHGTMRLAHIFVRVQGTQIDVALLDLEKSRQRLLATSAALHDIKQLKRHSSWNTPQWQAFIYGYETAFGTALKGL
jgi:hypothetical protein